MHGAPAVEKHVNKVDFALYSTAPVKIRVLAAQWSGRAVRTGVGPWRGVGISGRSAGVQRAGHRLGSVRVVTDVLGGAG